VDGDRELPANKRDPTHVPDSGELFVISSSCFLAKEAHQVHTASRVIFIEGIKVFFIREGFCLFWFDFWHTIYSFTDFNGRLNGFTLSATKRRSQKRREENPQREWPCCGQHGGCCLEWYACVSVMPFKHRHVSYG